MNVLPLSSVPCAPQSPDGHCSDAWRATGDAASDLPSWISKELEHGASMASTSVSVAAFSGEQLAQAAFTAFSNVLNELDGAATRVWAYLPMITARDSDGLDRYMRMNVGRAQAYRAARWPMSFMPAGTCVGHAGDALVVHALAMPGNLRAIENARQLPAWQYSSKFGPSAPPFTRAVVSDHLLMASGTAAVVGEDVVHPNDIDAQWREALGHLAALRASAGARGRWRAVQIYVREKAHISIISRLAHHEFPDQCERVLHAPLCRDALLVEVEAVADV